MAVGVAELRSFNRFYTREIGVLTDRYLGQARPLAAARLLFEIGANGAEVHELRERLGLDSGYLSRLLRSLERAGLVDTVAHPGADNRRKVAQPTSAGLAELAEMNRRADADMARLIEPLDAPSVRELIAALATVERLLNSSTSDTDDLPLIIRVATVADAEAVSHILRRSFADQRAYFTPGAFAASTPSPSAIAERIINDRVWVAERGHQAVGTVSAAVQRSVLWIRGLAVLPEGRGAGLALRLLAQTERYARGFNLQRLELDTTPFQTAAATVYEQFGFRSVRRHAIHGTPMIRMTKALYYGIDGGSPGVSRTATSSQPDAGGPRVMFAPSLDYRRFRDVSLEHAGDVGGETTFEYHETPDGTIWARYEGGNVRLGFLVGRRERDTLVFRYAHMTVDGDTATGHCTSEIEQLMQGRLKLKETWAWDSRQGHGTSVLEEIPT